VDLGAAGVADAGLPDLERPAPLVVELAGERRTVGGGSGSRRRRLRAERRGGEEDRDGGGEDSSGHGAHPGAESNAETLPLLLFQERRDE
jgi:hypothetical protein